MSSASEAVRNTYNRKKQLIQDWKAERGCSECGETDPIVLDAHHRDPDTKHPRLKKHDNHQLWRLGWAALRAELEKCDVLCANCHRRQWFVERGLV